MSAANNEPPRATIRLQLHKGFNFADAVSQIPYFYSLGISHLYLSPVHVARAGSLHGYDVVDYGAVNPELGGEEGFRELVAALRAQGMGVIVDVVPNHMAVGGDDNQIWLDVLEWGIQSRYAQFFDIDWEVSDPALHRKVHMPFLGKPYGEVLAEGDLRLHFDEALGRFYVAYFEHRYPIAAREYGRLLRRRDPILIAFAEQFSRAVVGTHRREQRFEEVCQSLAAAVADGTKGASAAVEALLAEYDSDTAQGRTLLHRLLERQHYRLAWWQTAADEINWRRFFDVTGLAGLRIQELHAFEIVHANTLRLYQEGLVDGLRIDHVDGIADPRAYCRRLRHRLNKLNHLRPEDVPSTTPFIFVEKILAPEERLNKEWQVDGDTGYSFMNQVSALLHQPEGEEALTHAWQRLTGQSGEFEKVEKQARRRTLRTMLAADFNACAYALHRIARNSPETRDFTLRAIQRVLTEILAEFPVYRTYVDGRGRSAPDSEIMQHTLRAARANSRRADYPLVDAIDRWLGGEAPQSVRPAAARRARLRAIDRFQQLSSPVAAKSVEDTAFYRYGPLLSRNEVGSTPSQFSISAADFHQGCRGRRRRYPNAMLCTATHDHKRGEDLRARLAVLSEIPHAWLQQVDAWRRLNRPLKENGDGGNAVTGPDAADEYMLYQMLAGAWALSRETASQEELRDRLAQWQEKALREAKRNSNWTEPNLEYEEQCRSFLFKLLNPDRSAEFIRSMQDFVDRIAAAGAVNSLTQTLVKLTCPGIPDMYQGCEQWDFSFVDPDNRRPVDYGRRREALERLEMDSSAAARFSLLVPGRQLLDDWRSGRIKQALIASVLNLRRDRSQVFAHGTYVPLSASGPLAEHVFCFAREFDEQVVISASVRFAARLSDADRPAINPELWQGTDLVLPRRLRKRLWRNLLAGKKLYGGRIPVGELFSGLTVAVLVNDESD